MKTQQHTHQGGMKPLASIKKLSLGELFTLLNLITQFLFIAKGKTKESFFLLAQQFFKTDGSHSKPHGDLP